MKSYNYSHNLTLLDEVAYNERSGRPNFTYHGNRFEVPALNPLGIAKGVINIVWSMIDDLPEFKRENPFLFHVSKLKEETPQSIKIRKILIWAGVDTTQEAAVDLIGLFQRPKQVPEPFVKYSGYTLTRALGQSNAKKWHSFQLASLVEDFFLGIRESSADKYDQLSRAFFVAASVPKGINNFRVLKNFLPDYDKTTMLFFLIFKNGKKLSEYAEKDIWNISSEERKKIGELFAFAHEWELLQPYRDPALMEKDFVRFKDVTHVDLEKRVIGTLNTTQGLISHESFCTAYSFGNYQPGDVVYRSLGKMNQDTLKEASIVFEEKWWLSVSEKKNAIVQRAQKCAHQFNEESFSCINLAEKKGYLTRGDKSKLIIYFLSFLREEHRQKEPHFCIQKNEEPNFDVTSLEERCALMGLWIRHVLKNDPSMERKEFEFLLCSGGIHLKVMQEFGDDGQLLPEPILKECKYLSLVSPKTDIGDKEINRVYEDYLTTLVYKELQFYLK